MNGKTARMLREMQADDKRSKKLWKSLTHIQQSKVSATYNTYEDKKEGAKEAVVTFMEQLFGRKITAEKN